MASRLYTYTAAPPVNPRAWLTAPKDIAHYQSIVDIGYFDLTPSEIWWSSHHEQLQSHGYILRPRFRPAWTPSWQGKFVNPYHCEDAFIHLEENAIDAKRISDGAIVVIKRVDTGTEESRMARMLSTPQRLKDPQNPCVPIVDYFRDDNEEDIAYLVMPLLRAFHDPPFYSVDEVIDFMKQTLEGLNYIHKFGVAHRDLSDANIMMIGESLYPLGFHPSWQDRLPLDIAKKAPYIPRREAGSVKYYFTDFGLSTYFRDPDGRKRVVGRKAADGDVPEFGSQRPYDPYPVDVFTLGRVFSRNFLDKYSNLGFLQPLIAAMTQYYHTNRPTARQAVDQFDTIISKQSGLSLNWRLRSREESFIPALFRDIQFAVQESNRRTWTIVRRGQQQYTSAVFLPLSIVVIVMIIGPRGAFRYLGSPFTQH